MTSFGSGPSDKVVALVTYKSRSIHLTNLSLYTAFLMVIRVILEREVFFFQEALSVRVS